MQVTMISNYINHHQIPFSQALYEKLGDHYHFIQTEPMEEERIQMGWGLTAETIPYVSFLDKEPELCKQLINDSDLLLVGWMEHEELLSERLNSDKLTLRISERLYREGQWKAVSPKGLLRKYKDHTSHRKDPVYLLCAGAYVPSDFHIVRAYPERMYRFGYFPETRSYSEEEWKALKNWEQEELQLVWAGRFIPLKHPEFALRLAKSLKEKGDSFHLHMVGGGELEAALKQQVAQEHLEEQITFYGFQKPEAVRDIMEQCHIHLFTSNYLEGWGAVVNEAMNSGCAVVVNSEVGAAPYLITHGENGLVYKNGSYEDFEKQVCYLLRHPLEGKRMGKSAYKTIIEEWNSKEAAERVLQFYEEFQKGSLTEFSTGPMSKAPVISPNRMYQHMMEKGRGISYE